MESFFREATVNVIAFFSLIKDILISGRPAAAIGIIGGADGPTDIHANFGLSPRAKNGIILVMAGAAFSLVATAVVCLIFGRRR